MSGLTPNQWTILETLARAGRWARSFQTVKPLLNDLIERGLVERCRPHLGRAANRVRLTEAGCGLLEVSPADVPAEEPRAALIAKKRRNYGPPKVGLSGRTKAVCEAYVAGMARGEVERELIGQIAELHDVQRPAIWKHLRAGGVLPPYSERTDGGRGRPSGGGAAGYSVRRRKRALEVARERRAEPPLSQFVSRDPCPRCGVRRDIGCGHSLAPIGMTF